MKKTIIGLLLVSSIVLASCVTAIEHQKGETPIPLSNTLANKSNIEFIGYKIDSNILSTSSSSKMAAGFWTPNVETVMSEFDQAKAITNTSVLAQLGFMLENNGLAIDKSNSYFGIYSLQELELYKSNKRYVSFVEVAKNKIDYKENKSSKYILGGIGGGFLIAGIPLTILGIAIENNKYTTDMKDFYTWFGASCTTAGAIATIPALIPVKTTIDFNGLYNVYVYDTETKKLIRKDSVSVACQKKFKGAYSYDDSSKDAVHSYLASIIANRLLQKYIDLNKWLLTQEQ